MWWTGSACPKDQTACKLRIIRYPGAREGREGRKEKGRQACAGVLPHMQNYVCMAFRKFGKFQVRVVWLAPHTHSPHFVYVQRGREGEGAVGVEFNSLIIH